MRSALPLLGLHGVRMNFFYRYIDAKYLSSRDNKDLQIQIFLSIMLVVAVFSHLVLALYFVSVWSPTYIAVSAAGIALYLAALTVNRAGKTRAASFIYVLGITAFSVAATYFIGTDVNAQWLILLAILPTVLYFDFTKLQKTCLVAAMPILVNLQFLMPQLIPIPATYQGSQFLKFYYANTIVIGTLVILAVNEGISRKLAELRTMDLEIGRAHV